MSEIKQINTGVAELLAVKVPEGAREFKVFNDERPYLSFFNGILTPRIYLPPGNWTLLGIDTELTEEQCREVVSSDFDFLDGFGAVIQYPDYTEETRCYLTAKESFASLMQANGCFSENPFPFPGCSCKWDDKQDVRDKCDFLNEQYYKAEANTGTWLILKRLS